MKEKSFFSSLANIIGRLVVLAIVCLFLINIFRSIWKNHQTQNNISDLEDRISYLENENLNLKNRIIFYQSDIFKELQAKQHLGYIKKDEKLVVLVKDDSQKITSTQNNENKQTTQYQEPNWQSWYKYIFS